MHGEPIAPRHRAGLIALVFQQAVRTRRREFGIRRAVGAQPGDILRQVWAEGLMVSLLGGAIGLAVGMVATWGLARWRELPFIFDATVMLVPLVVVILSSLAGLYPARLAARLDPTQALRAT